MKIQSNECVLKKYGIEEFETLQMQEGGGSVIWVANTLLPFLITIQ